jgi:O-antigen/teichoic acid export membrane protein
VPRVFDPRPVLRRLSGYGMRSYGIDVLATLSQQIDQVLVVGILTAGQMGVYAVALAVSRVPQYLHQAVATVVFPTASGHEPERILAMVGRAARVSSLIAVVVCATLALAAPVVIPFVYGGAFANAVHVTQVLILEALVGGVVYVLSQAFMAVGRPGLVTVLQGFGLAIAIPAMLVLIPRFGLIGAALALLLSTIARLVFLQLSFPLLLRLPAPPLIPTADDLRTLARALPRGV